MTGARDQCFFLHIPVSEAHLHARTAEQSQLYANHPACVRARWPFWGLPQSLFELSCIRVLLYKLAGIDAGFFPALWLSCFGLLSPPPPAPNLQPDFCSR